MNTPGKRKISARQILADIRSGMEVDELKRRHRLSDKGLESVYRKLTAAGVLTNDELGSLALPEAPVSESSREEPKPAPWRCPACGSSQPLPVPECPRCGVIVAKFKARQAREKETPSPAPRHDSAVVRPWLFFLGTVMVIAVAGGAWFLLSGRPDEVKSPKAEVEAGPSSRPGTGREFVPLVGKMLALQYSPEGFPLGLAVSQRFALHLSETPSPSQGFKRMPPVSGAKRYYDEFTIAGKKYLVVTEASNPPNIYLDVNRNGDLTDDPGPFAGEGPSVVPNHYTLELPYDGEQETVPYRLWMFSSRMGGVRFYAKCHWHGLLTINDDSYKVVLFDGNADGDYSNDPVVIDVNDDGKAATEEKLIPGERISIDGTTVQVKRIARSGRWVLLLQ